MTNVDLREEIKRRVAAEIVPQIIQSMRLHHMKHDWRAGCDCTYCDAKRKINLELSYPVQNRNFETFARIRDNYRSRLSDLSKTY
jgi:epoxyqueuosine reductase QueG